jgi:hypothetical protein
VADRCRARDVLHGLRDRDGLLHDYQNLQARAVAREIGDERVHVVSLEDLLASKEWANRPKDREVIHELRAARRPSKAHAGSPVSRS